MLDIIIIHETKPKTNTADTTYGEVAADVFAEHIKEELLKRDIRCVKDPDKSSTIKLYIKDSGITPILETCCPQFEEELAEKINSLIEESSSEK